MYIIRSDETLHKYLNEMVEAFPEWFKPDPADYGRKMMITFSRDDASVMVEIVDYPPGLPVKATIGGPITINGHEVVYNDQKMLVHSILHNLISAIDVISPHDRQVITFHPTTH